MRSSPPLQPWIAGLCFCLATLAACLVVPGPGRVFDGGPCTWNFPSDDPCAASGLVCRFGPGGPSGGANCQLPGELFRCTPQLGCSDVRLACLEVPLMGLGSVPLCVRSCAAAGNSTDCPNPFSFCQPMPGGGPGGSPNACLPAACLGAYQLASCQGGGTCAPQALSSSLFAFCQAAGSASTGAGCSLGDSYGPLCTQGSVCLSQQCFPLCNHGAEPSCPSGTVCSPTYAVFQPAAFFEGLYAFCVTPCSADAGVGCPTPLICYESPGTQGLCLP